MMLEGETFYINVLGYTWLRGCYCERGTGISGKFPKGPRKTRFNQALLVFPGTSHYTRPQVHIATQKLFLSHTSLYLPDDALIVRNIYR